MGNKSYSSEVTQEIIDAMMMKDSEEFKYAKDEQGRVVKGSRKMPPSGYRKRKKKSR